jgi:hypothetical protein
MIKKNNDSKQIFFKKIKITWEKNYWEKKPLKVQNWIKMDKNPSQPEVAWYTCNLGNKMRDKPSQFTKIMA